MINAVYWKGCLVRVIALDTYNKSRIVVINGGHLICCWHIKYSLQFCCMLFYCLEDMDASRCPFQKHNFLNNQHLEVFLLCLKISVSCSEQPYIIIIFFFNFIIINLNKNPSNEMQYIRCGSFWIWDWLFFNECVTGLQSVLSVAPHNGEDEGQLIMYSVPVLWPFLHYGGE